MREYTETVEITTTTRPDGVIEVRTDTVTRRDGEGIARERHRVALAPGDDVSSQPERVREICAAVWTDEIVSAYRENVTAPPAN